MDYKVRLRSLREDNDYSQAEIGKVIQKSQQGYNHIELGRAELKIEDLVALCKFYNVSADYIIGLSDIPKPYKKWDVNFHISFFIFIELFYKLFSR